MEADRPPVLRTVLRFLTFQASAEELRRLDNRHLLFGLLCTWLVGIGRSWDDPKAELLQDLGIGSIAYVFALSLLLWGVVRPFVNSGLPYRQVLTMVCLVSPPGLIYAIPVEMMFDTDTAVAANIFFLVVVATWRVALLVFYLSRGLGLDRGTVAVTTLLPLCGIMAPLTVLLILNSIMSAMMGQREPSGVSRMFEPVVGMLGMVSILAFLPLVATYIGMVERHKRERTTREAPTVESPNQ